MKSIYSIERRERIGSINRDKNLSNETKEKIREKALARVRPSYTEQANLNMKKKSKAIVLYNKDNTVYGKYLSIVETAKSIGCNEKTRIRALKTENKLLKRRLFVKYK
jgi:hypothetical protein